MPKVPSVPKISSMYWAVSTEHRPVTDGHRSIHSIYRAMHVRRVLKLTYDIFLNSVANDDI